MTEQVSLQTVTELLARLVLHYPEAGHNGKTIQILARDYHEDLVSEQVTTAQCEMAIKMVRRRCNFFPKVADVLKAVGEYRSNPPQIKNDRVQIADHTDRRDLTPEEIDRNKQRLQIMSAVAVGKISPEEGERLQQELNRNNIFSGRLKVVEG